MDPVPSSLILIVDDEEPNRYVLSRVLKQAGYRTHEADNARGAQAAIDDRRPDLIFLDVRLPDMNGYDLCRRLRANRATAVTPIVQTSAYFKSPADAATALECGADSYLTQPVDPGIVLATVSSLLRNRKLMAERLGLMERADTDKAVFRALTENAASALFMMDERGIATFLNPAAESLIQYRLEELGDKPLLHHLLSVGPGGAPRGMGDSSLGAAFMAGRDARGEETFRRRDGSSFPARYTLTRLRADGKLMGAVLELQDISEQKRMIEELAHSLRARDEFLSIASHELKTPLTGLNLQLQLLDRRVRASASGSLTREDIDVNLAPALSQVDRLSKMIERLLDVSRLRNKRLHLEITALDLATAVQDLCVRLGPAAEAAGSSLSCRAEGPIIGYWDPIRLEQVLTNLLSNAIKYGKGKPIQVEASRDGDRARIRVIDHGLGIPKEDQDRIFDRFERATRAMRKESLGLGLYITREIVQAHGGTIRVESAPDRGTTFIVELPTKRMPSSEGS